jgi:hypothetical protein
VKIKLLLFAILVVFITFSTNIFTDARGGYAPDFHGNSNAGATDPDAAPVCFDKVLSSSPTGISVTLSGIGVGDDDSIMFGPPFTINVHLNNSTGDTITALSTGFQLYSPDGCTWETPVYSTAGGLEDFFETITLEGFSLNGSGADTIGLSAQTATGGIPNGYDDIILTITTAISSEDTNKTICIDSCFFPPDGVWQWETTGGASAPDWDGPHCFGTKCYFGMYGFKYNDLDRNGQMDPGEPRMNGWDICPYIDQYDPMPCGPCIQTYTDTHYPFGDGCFEFTGGCKPAVYPFWLGEIIKPGWIQTEPSSPGRFIPIFSPGWPAGPQNFGNFCPCVKAPPNLMVWFPFDEASGPDAMNACGKTAIDDGVHFNNPNVAPGVVGNCLCFDGSSSYVEALSPIGDIDLSDFTVDAWIYRDLNDDDTGVRTILDKRVESGGSHYGYSLYLHAGRLGFHLASGPHTNWTNIQAYIPVGEWHHVAVTVERQNPSGIIFYLDGAPVGPTYNPTFYQYLSLSNSGPFRVASRSFELLGMFNGCIDEVEVFDRVLRQMEILDIYHHGKCGAGKCKHKCSIPKYASYSICGSSITVKACIINLNPGGRYFTYSFQGLPATTTGCDINGPTVFTYIAPPIWVGPGLSKAECIDVEIDRPAFTTHTEKACYEMCVRDMTNHQIVCCVGRLTWGKWDVIYDGPLPTFAKSGSSDIWHFEVTNLDSVTATLDYHFSVIDEEFNLDSSLVSLDGFPPGTPVTGSVEDIPPGESTDLNITVEFTGADPLNIHSLFLQCYDNLELQALTSVRLMGLDEQYYICGDANSDDVVNVSDAVYIINYVFVGGDPPDPMESGDANCDDVCNVSDAVWIINYVFVGGNDPCDTNGDGEPDC